MNEALENRVEHFDHLSTDVRRVFGGICQDKGRDEQVALDNTEQDKTRCEPKFNQIKRKNTRANEKKMRLKGLVDEFDAGQEFAPLCDVARPI